MIKLPLKYLFYIEGLDRKVWISGESEPDAYQKLWESLTDDERDQVFNMECIEVAEADDV